MGDLTTFAALIGFMLIPIWIPLATEIVGRALAPFRTHTPTAAERAVEVAKARTAARAEAAASTATEEPVRVPQQTRRHPATVDATAA